MEHLSRNQKIIIAVQVVIVCIVTIALILFFIHRNKNTAASDADLYPLINPAVMANLQKHYILDFTSLRKELDTLDSSQKHKTFLYFLYLNNSSWIGINERELFTAASTIKVPLAMSVYKLSENGQLNLKDTYKLDQSDIDSNFGTLYKVGAGQILTVQDLLQTTLQYSDNTAARALIHVTQLVGVKDPFVDVYNAMGWKTVDMSSKPSYIDINEKTLSNMFISLYNATYDTVDDSQSILHYLDLSDFNSQIVAGVPQDIPVSHKIGIDNDQNVYSDCGIVYVPHRPYILCLGMQGGNQDEADMFMQSASKDVYTYIVKN